MSKWHIIGPAAFHKERFDSKRSATVYSSPYEIPQALRAYRDPSTKRVVIQFRYIDGDEPPHMLKLKNGTEILLGKNSRRLFEIRIPEQLMIPRSSNSTTPAVTAVDAFVKDEPTPTRENYTIAREVLKESESSLELALCE